MQATDVQSVSEGRRRVLIAIGVATGLLCLLAAGTAYAAAGPTVATLVTVLGAGAAFGFAALLALGLGDWLTDDEQLLWSLGEGE